MRAEGYERTARSLRYIQRSAACSPLGVLHGRLCVDFYRVSDVPFVVIYLIILQMGQRNLSLRPLKSEYI